MAEKEITTVWANEVEIPAAKVTCPQCKHLDLNTRLTMGINKVWQAICTKGHMWTFKL